MSERGASRTSDKPSALVPEAFHPLLNRNWLRVPVGLVLLSGGGFLVWLGVDIESSLVAALGILLSAAGLFLLDRALFALADWRPPASVYVGLALAVLGSALAFALRLNWAVGAALLGLGFAVFRAGMNALCEASQPAKRWFVVWGWGGTAAGAFMLLFGVHSGALVVGAVGLLVGFLGLVPLSIGWRRLRAAPLGAGWTLAVGAVLTVLGTFFWPDEPSFGRWLALGLLLIISASFSWHWEGFALVVLAVAGAFWLLADRADESTPLDPHPSAPGRILALGDSYMSGEGADVYFPGTNVIGENQNQCRRSPTAFPYLVASDLDMGLDFFACSGARAIEIHKEGQMGPESPDYIPGELPQLAYLPDDNSRIEVVLVSIGGNDALFGKIGIACVLPGSCTDFRENWLTNVSRIGPGMTTAYKKIKAAVGDSTPIVAMPYPILLTEDGCGWSALNRSEHAFLYEFITVLNDRVRKSAEEAGINFFEPGIFAFKDARICDGNGPEDTVMNFFNVLPTQGGLLDRVNPTHWAHGTFHPQPSGHRAIADVLEPRLRQLLDEVRAGTRPANPVPNPNATLEIRRISAIQTVLVNTEDLPEDLACPVQEISAFGTLRPLIDANSSFALNAADDSPLCYTLPDGTWTATPGTVVSREPGLARIQPQEPLEGSKQRFIYRNADEGTWQIQVVEFCSKRPDCPTDVGVWMRQQVVDGAKRAVLPGILIFLGGWMLGLGFRVWLRPEE